VARTPADLARELEKVHDVLVVVNLHFASEAAMNAALHMSQAVRPAPLAVAVDGAAADLGRLIVELMGEDRTQGGSQ
jgi:hypothetical protein